MKSGPSTILQLPRQAIVERLNALRAQQLPAVDAACRRLEGVLQSDPYLQQRLCRVTVEAHSKALYSLHRCATLSALQSPLLSSMPACAGPAATTRWCHVPERSLRLSRQRS